MPNSQCPIPNAQFPMPNSNFRCRCRQKTLELLYLLTDKWWQQLIGFFQLQLHCSFDLKLGILKANWEQNLRRQMLEEANFLLAVRGIRYDRAKSELPLLPN